MAKAITKTTSKHKCFVRNCFMDLNVVPQASRTINKDMLQFLADYGYECVAFNHEVELAGKKIQIKPAPDINSIVESIPKPKRRGAVMKVLQRLTVVVDDPSVLHILSSPNVDSYDVLAIYPGSEKVLQQACGVLNVDIISMRLDERLPFTMKHTQIGQAVSRGVHFEISYSPAIRDATARRNTLANALELVDVARKKNIIVSSRAEKPFDTRGTADVVNLCQLFGLSGDVCKSCVTSHCRAALLHAAMRRRTAKGVVMCEPIEDTHPRTESTTQGPHRATPGASGLDESGAAAVEAVPETGSVEKPGGETEVQREGLKEVMDTGTAEETRSKRKRRRKSRDTPKQSKRRSICET